MVRLRRVEACMTGEPLRPDDAPSSLYGPDGRPQFFPDPAMDRFVAVLLNLASELWVQTERVDTLNTLVEEQGLATRADLARIGHDDSPARDAALQGFVARVLAPLREGGA